MIEYVDDYNYEPNDIESDIFLSEIPINLLKENIRKQFSTLEYRKKDHITLFHNMFRFSVKDIYDNNPDAEEELSGLEEAKRDFYNFMLDIFNEYLGIGFPDFFDNNEEEQEALIHYTYRFFLTNMKKNFVNYIIHYINENRALYDGEIIKKDITTISSKRYIDDIVDINVLADLTNIIDSIIYDDIDIDEFLRSCKISNDSLETIFVFHAFNNLKITGNFINKYVEMIDDDFKSDIEIKVRNKILKKYNKVKRTKVKDEPIPTDDIDETTED